MRGRGSKELSRRKGSGGREERGRPLKSDRGPSEHGMKQTALSDKFISFSKSLMTVA
jgi:hypothetical protein